jgi:hypothetical protein
MDDLDTKETKVEQYKGRKHCEIMAFNVSKPGEL